MQQLDRLHCPSSHTDRHTTTSQRATNMKEMSMLMTTTDDDAHATQLTAPINI